MNVALPVWSPIVDPMMNRQSEISRQAPLEY
jgi:hypothetical protein